MDEMDVMDEVDEMNVLDEVDGLNEVGQDGKPNLSGNIQHCADFLFSLRSVHSVYSPLSPFRPIRSFNLRSATRLLPAAAPARSPA